MAHSPPTRRPVRPTTTAARSAWRQPQHQADPATSSPARPTPRRRRAPTLALRASRTRKARDMSDVGNVGRASDDLSSAVWPAPLERRMLVAESARIMATEISVQLAAPPDQEAAARAAAQACMALFTEVDERLSRFKPESELSRLNRAAGQWFRATELL